MRKHLMKRHKVKDRGIGLCRFPSQRLYKGYGLYKVSTTAGWKKAHVLAWREEHRKVVCGKTASTV